MRSEQQGRPGAAAAPHAWWSLAEDELLRALGTARDGLDAAEAARRLDELGSNELSARRPLTRLAVFGKQLRSPLLLLLFFAAAASLASGEWADAGIVSAIALASVGIGYSREYSAQRAAEQLQARVRTQASVVRDARVQRVPLAEVVPGDVVLLSAGVLVPADARVLESNDLYVNEAVLTGESFPAAKKPGRVEAAAALAERTNCVHLGTSVRSGSARCVVVSTGNATQFGAVASRLTLRPPETEFDRGLKRFGYLLTSAMLVMVVLVFALNALIGRPLAETLLFSIALAVGLSPELLPAILSVNLARGAQAMARHGVLVKHLAAIENLGSMDVLCTDKTGTLTEGVVRLGGAFDEQGRESSEVLTLAARNAALQTGLANPLDEAILDAHRPDLAGLEKLGEIPYDFVRKRLSVVLRGPRGVELVTKGAFEGVLEACTRTSSGRQLDEAAREELRARFRAWSREGTRVLGVASRALGADARGTREDEHELVFAGFLTFLDRPKPLVRETLAEHAALGVSVKVITGDTQLVAQHVAAAVGLRGECVLTGRQLDELHDEALWQAAERTDIFAEVDPNQKERIILALKKTGHVVGFLGDGINDAPAMHAADTSLSVEEAVDVAREAADFVLLERDLSVLRRGIEEGRRTFANTLKYVLTTTSANLGNMLSMALASAFLPFLPLLAGQILLNNFLSDIPAIGLANDAVDAELVARPRRWDMRLVARYMVGFGLLSSAFDMLTFALLLWVFPGGVETFRTAWFVESLLTELVIALVVRTRRRFYQSRPGTFLLRSTIVMVLLTFTIPFLPGAELMGFVPLQAHVLGALALVTALYVLATELLKARIAGRRA